MSLELVSEPSARPAAAQVRALGVFGDLSPASGTLANGAGLAWQGFTGALGETLRRVAADGAAEILVGLGARERLDREALRRVGAALARAAAKRAALVVDLGGLDPNGLGEEVVAGAIAEGVALASYQYERYKSEPHRSELAELSILGVDPAAVERGIARARLLAEAVGLARDLVNTPGSDLTPRGFAEIARACAAVGELEIEVLDEKAIAKAKLGGILGVARGSDEPPRLVRLGYNPPNATASTPLVCLVGKGITFDSGGLAIKTLPGMLSMKTDMSGAAAVLATLSICHRLAIGVRVVAYMPLTENMSGGSAVKPGDILRARNGKTIEVANPDAEGRLVLADALSLAVELEPDLIVDLATLTGACVTALGNRIGGLMGNDDRAIAALRAASALAGEALWPLPLPEGYRSHIDSELADMRNTGNGTAGTLAAGLLLEEFVADVPWAHLDIAGPARTAEDYGYVTRGGTGFGVRTLVCLLEHYEATGGKTKGVPEGRVVFW